MLVSVIVVAHNSSALLVECVRHALASSVAVEVIVSDNDSSDASIEALVDLAVIEPRLRVLRHGRNLGFAAGNAQALPYAGGDYVLFLNPDCLVAADTLARVIAALDAEPRAGMAGCVIRNPDGSEEPSDRRVLPTPGRLLRQMVGRGGLGLAPLPTTPIEVEAISGAFMLVRRDALEQAGCFDTGYFMHWEDLDLCRRFGDAGWSVLFVPDVEVLHYKGRSSRSRPLRVEWYKHLGLARYLRKFHFSRLPLPFFLPVALAVGVRFGLRAIVLSLGRIRRPVALPEADPAGHGPEVWVFGATSVIGRYLLPRLLAAGYRVRAFCTDPVAAGVIGTPRLVWHSLRLGEEPCLPAGKGQPFVLVHLAPLPLLVPWIKPLVDIGLTRLIAFGSTSRYTKQDSVNPKERRLAQALAAAETEVAAHCGRWQVPWAVFRPTMIYCLGHERNITLLAGFIRRFRFFALPGEGRGLRQPVHADDLARACVQRLGSDVGWNRGYNLSGGQTLSYRAMVEAVFRRLGLKPRFVTLPRWTWQTALGLIRLLPGYRDINMQMLERVDQDMCFDHGDASRDWGYLPRPFQP